MRSRTLVTLAALAALGFGTAAQAQGWDHQRFEDEAMRQQQLEHWRNNAEAQQRQDNQWQQRHWQERQRQWQGSGYYVPQYPQQAYGGRYGYAPGYYGAPQYGYAHHPHYYAGGYYNGHRRWVNDWRSRGLYAPPYGYGWVETDTGDVLLIALASGLIANAIIGQ